MKPKTIDADALLGYLQGKWNSNNRLDEETLKRLGKTVSIQKSVFLLHDVASEEYRQAIDNIFEECKILDMTRSSSELILTIAHQFGLQIK